MSRPVVDASVAVKWLVPEVHSGAAERWLEEGEGFAAPDILYAEVGNALWKRAVRGEITAALAAAVIKALDRMPIRPFSVRNLAPAALDLACRTGRSVYDCLYLALAIATNSFLVTADRRLYDAITGGRLAGHIRWVESPPSPLR